MVDRAPSANGSGYVLTVAYGPDFIPSILPSRINESDFKACFDLVESDPNKMADLEEGCSVTAGGMTADEFISMVNERKLRAGYDAWANSRPHRSKDGIEFSETCFEAYCAGVLDGKVLRN